MEEKQCWNYTSETERRGEDHHEHRREWPHLEDSVFHQRSNKFGGDAGQLGSSNRGFEL